VTGGEVLVELDGKTLGIIAAEEFGDDPLPRAGSRLDAIFERHDRTRDLAVLSVGGARRQVLWEEIRPGMIVEGTVTAVNKGGLTVDVKGVRAFLPASQVARERIEDLSGFVGQKLRCEVTSVNRAAQDLVLSRRVILDREAEELRGKALARLSEGEVLKGTVTRMTEHGAFIDLGGIEGLLPARRLEQHLARKALAEPLRAGDTVEVQVTRIESERGRVGLDLKPSPVPAQSTADWARAVEGYRPGDVVTGWVVRREAEGAVLSIGEGVEAILAAEHFGELDEAPRRGAILKAAIAAIDPARRRITLRPHGR
jgi:small subunit ribosomal protein S1